MTITTLAATLLKSSRTTAYATLQRFARRSADVAQHCGVILLDLLASPFVFACRFFGAEDLLVVIGERRGYFGSLCPNGCADVHDVTEICARAIVADCDLCVRTIDADAAGNCSLCGNRRVTNRRSKKTGKRLRPSHPKLTVRPSFPPSQTDSRNVSVKRPGFIHQQQGTDAFKVREPRSVSEEAPRVAALERDIKRKGETRF